MTVRRCLFSLCILITVGTVAFAEDWPQWFGTKRDGIWRETGILTKFPEGGPKVLWRQPIQPGYSGPSVANGKLYVMDRDRPRGEDGKFLPPRDKDDQGNPIPPRERVQQGKERTLCLDAATGKELWKHEYDVAYKQIGYGEGPRTTPTVDGDKVYTLGTMGDLYCLDANTGKPIWSKNLPKEYKAETPIWGWAASVLIEGDNVITLAGGEGSAVVALNKNTGKEAWKALTVQEIGYAPPVVFDVAGKRQLIIFHTESVNSLNPTTGEVYWTHAFPSTAKVQRPAITVATPRLVGDVLYVSMPHHGSLALKLAQDKPGAKLLWEGKSDNLAKPDGLHCLMNTPVIKDGHLYGFCNAGELRCLKADTGDRVWESYDATDKKKNFLAHAFLIPHEDRYFIFNDHGEMIIAQLSPEGYKEISRATVIEPTFSTRGRTVVWAHPAFANRCVFLRNDKEIICISLAADGKSS